MIVKFPARAPFVDDFKKVKSKKSEEVRKLHSLYQKIHDIDCFHTIHPIFKTISFESRDGNDVSRKGAVYVGPGSSPAVGGSRLARSRNTSSIGRTGWER